MADRVCGDCRHYKGAEFTHPELGDIVLSRKWCSVDGITTSPAMARRQSREEDDPACKDRFVPKERAVQGFGTLANQREDNAEGG